MLPGNKVPVAILLLVFASDASSADTPWAWSCNSTTRHEIRKYGHLLLISINSAPPSPSSFCSRGLRSSGASMDLMECKMSCSPERSLLWPLPSLEWQLSQELSAFEDETEVVLES